MSGATRSANRQTNQLEEARTQLDAAASSQPQTQTEPQLQTQTQPTDGSSQFLSPNYALSSSTADSEEEEDTWSQSSSHSSSAQSSNKGTRRAGNRLKGTSGATGSSRRVVGKNRSTRRIHSKATKGKPSTMSVLPSASGRRASASAENNPRMKRGESFQDETSAANRDGDTFETGSQNIRWAQKLVLATIVGIGILCCISTYVILTRKENDEFEDSFEDASETFFSTSHIYASTIMSSLTTMSTTTTSFAVDTNVTWPFVHLPHFRQSSESLFNIIPRQSNGDSDQDMYKISGHDGAPMEVFYAPLVPRAERQRYEAWTIENEHLVLTQNGLPQTTAQKQPSITPFIFRKEYTDPNTGQVSEWEPVYDDGGIDSYFAPIWESNPVRLDLVNNNLFHEPDFQRYLNHVVENKQRSIVSLQQVSDPIKLIFMSTILDSFIEGAQKVVAVDIIRLPWISFLQSVLSQTSCIKNVHVGIQDSCTKNQYHYYHIDSDYRVTQLNIEEEITSSKISKTEYLLTSTDGDGGYCPISISIFSTDELEDDHASMQPRVFTAVVALLFVVLLVVFVIYDRMYQEQQDQAVKSAEQSHAFISSLFPAQFRDRLLFGGAARDKKQRRQEAHPNNNRNASLRGSERDIDDPNLANDHSMDEDMMSDPESVTSRFQVNKPIAELFIQCTVMFADIAGFTAWSSQREPAEVFTLLESVYSAFDAIAKRQQIFKVETIGDCYVAVAGLPERREDHAEAMAKFANACRRRMNQVVRKLEVILGPDTADLSMRFGLHSGPVTAGVLRGDKSRFQLFGDTVNTACRIESTGARDRIHLSEETANILIAKGMRDWVSPRDTLVEVKGKGMMQTWWLIFDQTQIQDLPPRSSRMSNQDDKFSTILNGNGQSSDGELQIDFVEDSSADGSDYDGDSLDSSDESSSSSANSMLSNDSIDEKTMRLIEWNVDIMAQQLKKITAMREEIGGGMPDDVDELIIEVEGDTVLDEVREIINLSTQTKQYKHDPDDIDLGEAVVDQLQQYVEEISKMYRDNPFHSFEHASHVTQSVAKLMARVVTPDSIDYEVMRYKKQTGEAQLHEYTYGITSDPLIHFACIYSALIHDVDHSGLPNANLIECNQELADRYKKKSVAEQNSVDLSWELLMEPRFVDLRGCIYMDQEEMDRFRQLVVNSVMATDIADKELGALRRKRWETAFDQSALPSDTLELQRDSVNRKATIVIEHLIQASDVSHTMQHWHVYRKWNEKLFHEMYRAYTEGKSEKDPSIGWYEGELGFFDFYIIPLAKKLKECGCFGVSSDEYLNYATANRSEWQLKGWEIVRGYMTKYRHSIPAPVTSQRQSSNDKLGSRDLVSFLMAGHNQQQKK